MKAQVDNYFLMCLLQIHFLRSLETGSSFKTLGFSFHVGVSTVGKIIKKMCKVLWEMFQPVHMQKPTLNYFKRIAEGYKNNSIWNFPICIGALDRKHIRIKCPPHSKSMFFLFFSVVLQGLVGNHYKFISYSLGSMGSKMIQTFFKLHHLKKVIFQMMQFYPTLMLDIIPHVFIADEA